MDAFTGLDAVADAARCQHAWREAGRRRPTLRSRHSYGTDLSPREQQVADLLATGATNKEIAHALALSVRTVEHHVASGGGARTGGADPRCHPGDAAS
ncbi:LuxR C-terminal-related transcriptional regulator [Streptomyces sp. Amel2xC10]|uniref:LuxR C-terminal-related transcriptional regulator n=1 Tax=Streptomyces sp. Amel2xC10 TaxID=1305826 RepID=UPI0015C4CE4F|nr:LuxR C-terminal-related transcriptional regulator [Streptomyces sp. Amel2xC10]